MPRSKGRDSAHRQGKKATAERAREVYVFAEGAVTEELYIDIIRDHGTRANPGRRVNFDCRTTHVATKYRKPVILVDEAVKLRRSVTREARRAGLTEDDWSWPQVWCLFDRDKHEQIPTAFADARAAGVHIAYSHPCFELWRLLHYQNYTSTFGGVCNSAADLLKGQPGFAKTYGPKVTKVSDQLAKSVRPDQVVGGYKKARSFAKKLNAQHTGPDQTTWDPYTDVWRFVEDALDLTGY
ncbi:RloB domain-containing protein [Streptomyces armeniacus]|uniref:RloB domain-containing protein n=1 Tax=Streptomyces armeniacus TaxID=83291 RepID=A0A345XMU1_9ACTN|nr:RloB family protein [Streptomyces armeniacus]AXK32957.1 RloB domain-containing protein [Streptomyces armeniacus]